MQPELLALIIGGGIGVIIILLLIDFVNYTTEKNIDNIFKVTHKGERHD